MDVLIAGETLVDFLSAESGPLASTESFRRRAGGAPANVAVGLARLGVVPRFWTRIARDPFGDFLASTLADEGIPEEFVVRDPAAKTTLAFVALDDDSTFAFRRDGTADTRLEPGTIPDERLAAFDWVHVGGVTLAAGPARAATFDLMERAAAAGATVSFDPNARPELWASSPHDFPASVRRAFGAADVVTATPADLAAAGIGADADPSALARAVADRGPHTVLLTLGAAGARARATAAAPWVDGAVECAHEGYAVEAVDPTGAGDAFAAGALAALVGGDSLRDSLAFANAVAAITTTGRGAMTALPSREAVRAFRRRTTRR